MSKVASDLVRMRRILTGEGRDNKEATLRAERDKLFTERAEMVKALRSMCAEQGDNGWTDSDWLPDVILNHLTSKWKNHKCQLDFSGVSPEDRGQPNRKFGRKPDPLPATEDDEPLTGEDLRAIDETRDFIRSGGKLLSLDAFDSMIDARIADDNEPLTSEDSAAIARAQDDVRSGRVFTTEQLIRELDEELDD